MSGKYVLDIYLCIKFKKSYRFSFLYFFRNTSQITDTPKICRNENPNGWA